MSEELTVLNPKRIRNRRIKVFGLMFVSTLLATIKWTYVIPTDSALLTKFLMVALFVLTFAWIALFFWSSIFGFFELLFRRGVPGITWVPEDTKLSTRTAVLMPVYNECSRDVFANLLAMADDLDKTGQGKSFDMFVLSDTTNPKLWVEEERCWLEAKKLMPETINLYYRRRAKNTARKSGNIEDFCVKWGCYYDFMIVLDADSLMNGKTMLKMAQLMENNQHTGIIQAPPMTVGGHTLFARMQQFAGKVYGPIVAAGLAYWQVGDSNYWGHNAIIRVKAFMECCGLPVLEGKAPFGGHILSHDFVEAALIRRGGWSAWLLPELKGSYEGPPPTMIDFAGRDRRWCQGNMQHIKILLSKHLHPVSRIHFTIGIMSYLSSPIWLCFLLVGLAIALGRVIFPPVYFPEVHTLFPTWPIFDKIGTIALFVLSMFMLIFPKFLGLIIYYINEKKTRGAFKSMLAEIVMSALSAPIMMMFQSKFVLEIFTGHAVGWSTQNRGDRGTSCKEAFQRHIWHTVLGIVTTIVVALYARQLFWWMLPITVGLMFSIPISMLTSRVSAGRWAKRHNYFVIPEELNVPQIMQKAAFYEQELGRTEVSAQGVELLLSDNTMANLHIFMLPVNGPAPEFSREVADKARIKLENWLNHRLELDLSKDEELSLLYNADLLKKATVALLLG